MVWGQKKQKKWAGGARPEVRRDAGPRPRGKGGVCVARAGGSLRMGEEDLTAPPERVSKGRRRKGKERRFGGGVYICIYARDVARVYIYVNSKGCR